MKTSSYVRTVSGEKMTTVFGRESSAQKHLLPFFFRFFFLKREKC